MLRIINVLKGGNIMLLEQKEKLQRVISLVDNVSINSDVDVDYFIPGVLVTAQSGKVEFGGPYIEFSYGHDGTDKHVQHLRLTHNYLEKSSEDLANYVTFSLEQFMGEIDARQYGAQ